MVVVVAVAQSQSGRRSRKRPDATARIVTTRTTRILAANGGAAALLQCDVGMLVQKPLAALVVLRDRADLRDRVVRLRPDEPIEGWHFGIRGSRGESIAVVATVCVTGGGDHDGDVLEWTLAAAPAAMPAAEPGRISNPLQAKLGRELRQLAHEINQPLAAIVTYARGTQMRLQSGALSDVDLRSTLDVLVDEALRATEIVRAFDRKWGSS
jgi:hypothetical protein